MSITPEQIDLWCSKASESPNLEFKEAKAQYDIKKLCEYCVAIANEGGGHLVLGVTDRPPRDVVGSEAFSDTQAIAEKLFQRLQFRVNVEAVAHPSGRVVVFIIPSRPRGTAYHYGGRYMMRSGEQLVPMSEDQMRRIFAGEQSGGLEKPKTDWDQHPDATYLAIAALVGSWHDKNQCDLEVITQLLGLSYDEWIKKALEILHWPDRPLSLQNGTWKVVNRGELWRLLGSRILDQNLDAFRSLAVSILKERNPAFALPAEQRIAARIHGKVLKYSQVLRKGIAEGLAILGSQPESCSHCSQGKAERISELVVEELLANADWILWGSLGGLLPTLAEAAPRPFLDAVEKSLSQSPSPFGELFAQEGKGITGSNYLTGLLWALEALAWDEQYIVRSCIALADLASHDPGGQWANRPFNSLVTILLPWLPQTRASIDKRKVVVQTILREYPDIAFKLIVQLLPGQHQSSFGSYKPKWRIVIQEGSQRGVTHQEYSEQSFFYAELAVAAAEGEAVRISTLIEYFDNLPQPAFDQLLQELSSQATTGLPEEQRASIWEYLIKFINKHRRFEDAEWALPKEIIDRVEAVAAQLAPTQPFSLYQHLFRDDGFEYSGESSGWDEQQKKLDSQRAAAISQIFQQDGIDGVIRFAKKIPLAGEVGRALGALEVDILEQSLLPSFLDSAGSAHKFLAKGFIVGRLHLKGWDWCDGLDKAGWSPDQKGQFLAYLPFSKETWDRASDWLQGDEHEYWSRVEAYGYQSDDELATAVEKLIEHGKAHAAINCLFWMHHTKQRLDINHCVEALLAAPLSKEPSNLMNAHHIVELIKILQVDPSVNEDDLFRVEWIYVPLLDGYLGATPKSLEIRLANDAEFFCEVIRLVYHSKKEGKESIDKPSETSRESAMNSWRLLRKWKIPPGTQKDGSFSAEGFAVWLQEVKKTCAESGHLDVALTAIGNVLIHSPSDPNGLWIHHAVAAAINDRDAERMREGYRIGIFHSRGMRRLTPTATQERREGEALRRKAEQVEDAGFHRFADALRELAEDYIRDAEKMWSVVDEHSGS